MAKIFRKVPPEYAEKLREFCEELGGKWNKEEKSCKIGETEIKAYVPIIGFWPRTRVPHIRIRQKKLTIDLENPKISHEALQFDEEQEVRGYLRTRKVEVEVHEDGHVVIWEKE